MNQQELEKEYNEFFAKWFNKFIEFSKDFDKLSRENKNRFHDAVVKNMPAGMVNIARFLNTKF